MRFSAASVCGGDFAKIRCMHRRIARWFGLGGFRGAAGRVRTGASGGAKKACFPALMCEFPIVLDATLGFQGLVNLQ